MCEWTYVHRHVHTSQQRCIRSVWFGWSKCMHCTPLFHQGFVLHCVPGPCKGYIFWKLLTAGPKPTIKRCFSSDLIMSLPMTRWGDETTWLHVGGKKKKIMKEDYILATQILHVFKRTLGNLYLRHQSITNKYSDGKQGEGVGSRGIQGVWKPVDDLVVDEQLPELNACLTSCAQLTCDSLQCIIIIMPTGSPHRL